MERESKIYWLNMGPVFVSVALVTTCDFLRRPFCYRFDSPPDVINVVSYEGFVLSPMSAIIITRCADWLCFVSVQQASLFIAQRAWCMETFCSTARHTKVRQSCLTYRLLPRFTHQMRCLAVTVRWPRERQVALSLRATRLVSGFVGSSSEFVTS